jgi:hypothetical protein
MGRSFRENIDNEVGDRHARRVSMTLNAPQQNARDLKGKRFFVWRVSVWHTNQWKWKPIVKATCHMAP